MRAAAMAELGKSDDNDDDEFDGGLNNPADYVLGTWAEHRLHDVLPEPGGFNDQDPSLVMEDWGLLNQIFNRWFARLSDDDGDDDDDLFDEPEGDVKGLQEL